MADEPIRVLRVMTVTPLFSPGAGLVHSVPEASRQKATDPKRNQLFHKCKYHTHQEHVYSILQGK